MKKLAEKTNKIILTMKELVLVLFFFIGAVFLTASFFNLWMGFFFLAIVLFLLSVFCFALVVWHILDKKEKRNEF